MDKTISFVCCIL